MLIWTSPSVVAECGIHHHVTVGVVKLDPISSRNFMFVLEPMHDREPRCGVIASAAESVEHVQDLTPL